MWTVLNCAANRHLSYLSYLSPNSTWFVASRLDTTSQVEFGLYYVLIVTRFRYFHIWPGSDIFAAPRLEYDENRAIFADLKKTRTKTGWVTKISTTKKSTTFIDLTKKSTAMTNINTVCTRRNGRNMPFTDVRRQQFNFDNTSVSFRLRSCNANKNFSCTAINLLIIRLYVTHVCCLTKLWLNLRGRPVMITITKNSGSFNRLDYKDGKTKTPD